LVESDRKVDSSVAEVDEENKSQIDQEAAIED